MERRIRLINIGLGNPLWGLSVEEEILRRLSLGGGPPTIVFWRSTPSVVLGRSNKLEEEVDVRYANKHGIMVVRRSSGGGAVYHDEGNLNVSVIIDSETLGWDSYDIVKNRRFFEDIVIYALKLLGLDARAKPGGIFVDNYKISGSAERIYKGALLHHFTVLVNSNLEVMHKVLRRVRYPTGNLSWFGDVRMSHIITSLICAFHDRGASKPFWGRLSSEELERVSALYKSKRPLNVAK